MCEQWLHGSDHKIRRRFFIWTRKPWTMVHSNRGTIRGSAQFDASTFILLSPPGSRHSNHIYKKHLFFFFFFFFFVLGGVCFVFFFFFFFFFFCRPKTRILVLPPPRSIYEQSRPQTRFRFPFNFNHIISIQWVVFSLA
jgi:hypothetical protein